MRGLRYCSCATRWRAGNLLLASLDKATGTLRDTINPNRTSAFRRKQRARDRVSQANSLDHERSLSVTVLTADFEWSEGKNRGSLARAAMRSAGPTSAPGRANMAVATGAGHVLELPSAVPEPRSCLPTIPTTRRPLALCVHDPHDCIGGWAPATGRARNRCCGCPGVALLSHIFIRIILVGYFAIYLPAVRHVQPMRSVVGDCQIKPRVCGRPFITIILRKNREMVFK